MPISVGKRKILLVLFIVFLLFIGYYLFFLVFPILFVGPPAQVYDIHNMDSIPHNLSVEIFDSDNNSVHLITYTIQPDKEAEFERQINWYLPVPDEYITWSHGTYTFQFTVDNNISKNITTPVRTWQTISVWLYHKGPHDKEATPIDIMIGTF